MPCRSWHQASRPGLVRALQWAQMSKSHSMVRVDSGLVLGEELADEFGVFLPDVRRNCPSSSIDGTFILVTESEYALRPVCRRRI